MIDHLLAGLPIKLAVILLFGLAACAQQEVYDPATSMDAGEERFVVSWNSGDLKRLYAHACETRHSTPEFAKECFDQQYVAGVTLIRDMVRDGVTPETIRECMDKYYFPEGTPDLKDIIDKACHLPKEPKQ